MSENKQVSSSSNKEETESFTPPARSLTLEFWVGLFAIAGVLCFFYLAVNLGGLKLSDSGYYSVSAMFTNVAGLKVGAPVEIAGVEIGEVSNVELNSTEAKLTLQVRDGIELRDDDIAQIRTKGIIGDKYVKISPGGSDLILESGDEIADTESAVEFEDVIGKFIHSMDSDE